MPQVDEINPTNSGDKIFALKNENATTATIKKMQQKKN